MSYDIVRFYAESRVAARKILPTTAPQIVERLERMLDSLAQDFGVSVQKEKILGVTPIILQQWYNAGSKRWKPATLNNYVSILRPFLHWAYSMQALEGDYSGVIHTVPLPDEDKLPPAERPKSKYYSHDQVEALLNSTHGHNQVRDRAMMALILFSSLRVSEMCSLTVGQYEQSKQNRDAGIPSVRRKGGSVVDVAIGDRAYELIDAYLATRKDLRSEDPLFITTHGNPCTRVQVYKALSGKQKELQLATGPHAMRHTCLSELEKTASPSIVRDAANHHSFQMTSHYAHTTVQQRRDALNRLPWN